jgi:hypothetical protein
MAEMWKDSNQDPFSPEWKSNTQNICKSVFFFLDFVHSPYFNKITTFRKLVLLPSSGKKEGQKP